MKALVLIWSGVLLSVLAVAWILTTDMVGKPVCGLVRASDGVCLDGTYTTSEPVIENKATYPLNINEFKPCLEGCDE